MSDVIAVQKNSFRKLVCLFVVVDQKGGQFRGRCRSLFKTLDGLKFNIKKNIYISVWET